MIAIYDLDLMTWILELLILFVPRLKLRYYCVEEPIHVLLSYIFMSHPLTLLRCQTAVIYTGAGQKGSLCSIRHCSLFKGPVNCQGLLFKNNNRFICPFLQFMDEFLHSVSYTAVHVFYLPPIGVKRSSLFILLSVCLSVCLSALLSAC